MSRAIVSAAIALLLGCVWSADEEVSTDWFGGFLTTDPANPVEGQPVIVRLELGFALEGGASCCYDANMPEGFVTRLRIDELNMNSDDFRCCLHEDEFVREWEIEEPGLPAGEHTISARVDADDEVDECCDGEDNNEAFQTVIVRSADEIGPDNCNDWHADSVAFADPICSSGELTNVGDVEYRVCNQTAHESDSVLTKLTVNTMTGSLGGEAVPAESNERWIVTDPLDPFECREDTIFLPEQIDEEVSSVQVRVRVASAGADCDNSNNIATILQTEAQLCG